jgi:hypothetical protein
VVTSDFVVHEAQPVERLPKARKDDADVQVRGMRLCLCSCVVKVVYFIDDVQLSTGRWAARRA